MQKIKHFPLWILIPLTLLAVLALLHPQAAQALPEYSAQTGEPCATCHISPSGGGPRGTRGQAWVGGGKPGIVPDLEQALELLGIRLVVDESQFLAPATTPAPADALRVAPEDGAQLNELLRGHDGN